MDEFFSGNKVTLVFAPKKGVWLIRVGNSSETPFRFTHPPPMIKCCLKWSYYSGSSF